MSFNQMESKKRLTKLKNSIDSKIRQTPPTLTQSVKTLIDGYNKAAPQLEPKDVNFVDYDGTILYTYTFEEARQLSKLPTPPDHSDEGLTFQGWNWLLDEVWRAENLSFIGAHYITSDKKTRIHFYIDEESLTNITLQLTTIGGTVVEVDWGDGVVETITKSTAHQYEKLGDYIITLDVISGKIGFSSGEESYGQFVSDILIIPERSPYHTQFIFNNITKVELGKDVTTFGTHSKNIKSLNIPIDITTLGITNYKVLVIPREATAFYLQNATEMETLCLPFSTPYATGLYFSNNTKLKNFGFTPQITSLSFSGDTAIKKLIVPDQINNLSVLNTCKNLEYVIIGKGVKVLNQKQFEKLSLNYLEIQGDVEIIPQSCFSSTTIKKLVLPPTIKTINNRGFYEVNIRYIEFSDQLTEIQVSAFDDSTAGYIKFLSKDLTFGNSVFHGSSYSACNHYFDFTNAYIKEDGILSYIFMSNVFQNIDKNSKIVFANKEIAEVAKQTTNLTSYANFITYIGEDEE